MRRSRVFGGRHALVGVAAAAVFGLVACEDDTAPPFEIEGQGRVEGRIYYDAERDGEFEPFEGDSAIAGVPVALHERNTDLVIANTTTGADGRFTFADIDVGTHDLVVNTDGLPSGLTVCRNPSTVTVYDNQVATTEVVAQGACIVTIAAAEEQGVGAFVVVRGVLTVTPDMLRSGPTVAYLQDESGGTAIAGLNAGDFELAVGDLIQVSGEIGQFGDELQLVSNPTVELHVPEVGAPDPTPITVAELAAQAIDPLDPMQGTLVRVDTVMLSDAFGAGGINEQNAIISDETGEAQLRIEANVIPPEELGTFFTVGNCYDLVGIAGQFSGDPQLKPRTTDDITEVPCE